MNCFASLASAVVREDPFPHLMVEDALPPGVCETLLREMPTTETLTRGRTPGDNKRFSFPSAEVLASDAVSATWKEVVRSALSQEFLDQVLRHFGSHLLRDYPAFEETFGRVSGLVAVPRIPGRSTAKGSVSMDAQIAINTPVLSAPSSVRCPHLDIPEKLFVGLLYLRADGDDSSGGNLELYRPASDSMEFLPDRSLPWESVKLEVMIPYRRNTLVLFPNSPRAFHGVSPRSRTSVPRYFLNLLGEVERPLFEVDWEESADGGEDNWFLQEVPPPGRIFDPGENASGTART